MKNIGLLLACFALGGCCVAEGTLVATPDGERPVESLAVGDKVLTVSPGGRVEPGRVVRIVRHISPGSLAMTTAEGRELRLTGWHPVATRSGWIGAGQLRRGQEVRTPSGWQRISAIRHVWGLTSVYDLTVLPNANFIAAGVLVHNKSYVRNLRPEELPGNWEGFAKGGAPGSYCRMELNKDGTGLFVVGDAPDKVNVLRITQWSTGEYKGGGDSYEFRAKLTHVRSGVAARLEGKIGWQGIALSYGQLACGRWWEQPFRVIRGTGLEKTMRACKDAMAAARPKAGQSK